MSSKPRRAAGSQTFADGLKVWSGVKKANPANDIADFEAGTTLEVSCVSRPLSDPKGRPQLGSLHLTPGGPVTWQRRRSEDPVTLDLLLTLAESDERPRQPQMVPFTLVTASGSFSVQIPTPDVDLVKHAFAMDAT